mgnify:CR=1 FL=1
MEIFDESNGLIVKGKFVGSQVTDAGRFIVGCSMLGADGKEYRNAGTVASPSWQDTDSISTSEIADLAVTTAKIAPAGIAMNKVAVTDTKFLVGGTGSLGEATSNMTWTKGTHPTRDTLRVGTITDNGKIIVSTDNLNALAIAGKSEATSATAGAEIQNFGWLTSNAGYNDSTALGTKRNRFNLGANMDADLLLSSPHQIRISAYDATTTNTDANATVEGGQGNIAMVAMKDIKLAPWSGGEDFSHQYLKVTAETETIFDVNTHAFTGGNLKLSTLSGPLNINGYRIGLGIQYVAVPAMFAGIIPAVAQTANTTTGAMSIVSYYSTMDTTGGTATYSLPDGTMPGHRKKVKFITDNGDAVITGKFTGAATTLTFTAAGDYAEMMWDGTDWILLENLGGTLS